jgi:hypothetical protein
MMGLLKDVICRSLRDLYPPVDGDLASNNTWYSQVKYLRTSFYLD